MACPRSARPTARLPGRKPVTEGNNHLVSELEVSPVLPVSPGLCGMCLHAAVKGTNRGTAYLRCTRAAWDDSLVKYPRLPVIGCVGFEPADSGVPPHCR